MGNKLCFRCIIFLISVHGLFTTSDAYSVNVLADETSELKTEIDHSSYRLPKEIVPISYDLSMYTRLGANDFAYQGIVKIVLKVLQTTNTVIVHNKDLIIRKEKSLFYRQVGKSLDPISINDQRYDVQREFFIIDFTENLELGEYVLILHFDGEVRDDVFGFYRTSYEANGETKWMGVTQFSTTHARRAFPCMDEPQLKATFTLHIYHSKNQTATSNTAVESRIQDPNNKDYYLTNFLPTPVMSTYLVGWIVHDFVPDVSTSSKNFKMWTRNSMNHRGSVSLNLGQSIYSSLAKWFTIENPISKMDQFAVPDFNFNAMENWGLITYRESVVLHEKDATPNRVMINGLTTMAHEYAHTWFGNLVTPEFWNVVWLKEGFASYFQYFGICLVEPSWGMMDKFVVDMLQPTLLADSVNHNRTMTDKPVGDSSSTMSMLDFVSYKKGASVIRMISHVIGESAFQRGLQSYLKNMSYQAAMPSDLYKHLQIATDKSNVRIKDFVESWADQVGYPLVTVRRNYTTHALVVSQEKFNQNRNPLTAASQESGWWIPLNFATKSLITDFTRTGARNWLQPREKRIIIEAFQSDEWVICNVQQVGYYRVNYDETNWEMLVDYLRSKDFRKIHKINRAALLDDAFNLAKGGYIDYSIPFNLSKYLIQETEYEPWVAATSNFKFLNRMLSSVPSVHRAFQEYAAPLLEPMYKKLDFVVSRDEVVTTKLHRELILSVSCSVNNTQCLRISKTLFGSWISIPDKSILPDIRSFVYCEGIRNGNKNDWYEVWDRFLHTDLHTEQELLLNGLGCTRDHILINEYLNSSIKLDKEIRKQYRISIINAILEGNPENVGHVLEFVRKNLKRIVDRRGHSFLTKVITAIGNKITTEDEAQKLRVLVDEKLEVLGTALSAAKEAIAISAENVKWVKKYSSVIADRLT